MNCELCGEADSDCERCDECGRIACDASCLHPIEVGMNDEPWTVCEECYWPCVREAMDAETFSHFIPPDAPGAHRPSTPTEGRTD